MKLILDASVALKWVLAEQDSAAAIAVRNDFVGGRHELLAPDLFPYEVGYVLTKAERRGSLRFGEAEGLAAEVFTTMPELYPAIDLLFRAITISSELRIGLYDCLYLALAEQESIPLLTADLKLASAAGTSFPVLTLSDLSAA